MKFENTEVMNFKNALRGMRNPLESWSKSDSHYNNNDYVIGKNDMNLAHRLIKSGTDHRKFLRQIFVSVDITAPLYWWKEYDTYKVGTVANSTSTMHKLATTPITLECFELDECVKRSRTFDAYMKMLEETRLVYLETKEKMYWRALIQMLPESWLQTRTCTLSYENLYSMIHSRMNHKLSEWSVDFINWCHTLPYADELLFLGIDEK